jgi:hypothetical protein
MIRRMLLSSVGLSVLVLACLPDPKADYEKYIEATSSQRTMPVGPSDAAIDAKPPLDPIVGNYFTVCYASLATGRMDRALRFYTEVDFKPSATGGTVSITLFPLKVEARTFSKANTSTKPPLQFSNIAVSSDTRFNGSLPMVAIEGGANPISGRDIEIVPANLAGVLFSKPEFCSGLSGNITKPIMNAFDAVCSYYALAEGAEFSFPPKDPAFDDGETMVIPSIGKRVTKDNFKTCF